MKNKKYKCPDCHIRLLKRKDERYYCPKCDDIFTENCLKEKTNDILL